MVFQLSSPLLDGCVLAVLDKGDAYGYSLTQEIKQEIDISESTLYPVLRRLQREGCLAVYDRQFQGRNRRYYTITQSGRELLADCRRDWSDFGRRVDHILSGGAQDE